MWWYERGNSGGSRPPAFPHSSHMGLPPPFFLGKGDVGLNRGKEGSALSLKKVFNCLDHLILLQGRFCEIDMGKIGITAYIPSSLYSPYFP